jgi:transposase
MSKVVIFENRNNHSAAIDIGSRMIYVSCDGVNAESFTSFTGGYRECIEYLKKHLVQRVCMEATGIYWIALYEMLEQAGFEVCLVNPKEVKQVKGRKTDVKDCCWIQKVFSAGLLRKSFIPAGILKELRLLVREREDIIEMGSTYVNKMQKCLDLMNIKLTPVLSQIQGSSGLAMIEAIVKGERDPAVLLSLCHKTIRQNKSEDILKALDGHYNESFLFLLEQNLKMWKIHQEHLATIDQKIEDLLLRLSSGKPEIKSIRKPKAIRHHKPKINDLHQHLLNIYGVDANCLPGITDYTLLRLLGEVGTDMGRFPTVKHFVSWCQLSPSHSQSGKSQRRVKGRNGSKAGQIFRVIAQAILNSKNIAIGSFMRKLRGRKDSRIAIKAGARKIAIAFYNLLTKGEAYVEQGVRCYEERVLHKERLLLAKLAKKHNLQLTQCQQLI